MKEKEFHFLTQEELSILKGGSFSAESFQSNAVEMGKDSCCNIHIKL